MGAQRGKSGACRSPPRAPAATPAAATLLPGHCCRACVRNHSHSLTRAPAALLHRTLKCERGLLTRADGSAQWTVGGTSCLASVTGPTQSMASSKEDAERATVDVIFKPRTGMAGRYQSSAVQCIAILRWLTGFCATCVAVQPASCERHFCRLRSTNAACLSLLICAGTRERQFEALIRRTCEAIIVTALHPRALIHVVVQVVSDDGGVLACALNAACAALVDAAVPLRTLFAAVSTAQQAPGADGEGGLLLDPSAAEEAAAGAVGTFAYLPLVGGDSGSGQAGGTSSSGGDGGQLQLLTSLTRGRLTSDQLLDMIEGGKQGADRLAAFMQQTARG